MPFNDANEYLKTYLTNHGEQLRKGEKITWALQKSVSDDVDELFNRDDENQQWSKLRKKGQPPVNKLIGLRAKIAWLCGCNRDMRSQFACGTNCRPRTHHDHHRLALAEYKWAAKGLTRMQDILNDRTDSGKGE